LGVVSVGFTLRREVRAYLADPRSFVDGKSATSLERFIAMEIASEADDITRNCRRYEKRLRRWVPTVTVQLLTEWTDHGEATVSEMLRRLSKRGLEMRKEAGKDCNGRPVYARKGHATEFYIPPLAALARVA
jgi:hypothetical protein